MNGLFIYMTRKKESICRRYREKKMLINLWAVIILAPLLLHNLGEPCLTVTNLSAKVIFKMKMDSVTRKVCGKN